TATSSSTTPAPPVPQDTGPFPATDLVHAPDGLAEATTELLRDVVVTADLEQARRIVREDPGLRAVTRHGDLLGAHWAHGGGARPHSVLEMRAAADEAAPGPAQVGQPGGEAAPQLTVAAAG